MGSDKKKFAIPVPEWFEEIQDFSAKLFPPLLYTGTICFVLLLIVSVYGFYEMGFVGFLRFLTVTCLIIGFLGAIFSNINRQFIGWVGFTTGITLIAVMSYVVSMMTNRVDIETQHAMVNSMLPAVQTISFFMAFFAVAYLVFYFFSYSMTVLSHKKEKAAHSLHYIDIDKFRVKAVEEKPAFIPTCWQTSKCRKASSKACPNFVDRVSCWKRCAGCYCDKQLAAFLVYVSNKTAVLDKPAINTVEQMRTDMRQHRVSWTKHKKTCQECPVFMEHQLLKYERLQWVGFPTAALIMGMLFTTFNRGYNATTTALGESIKGLSADNVHLINTSVQQSLTSNTIMTIAIEWVIFLAVTALLGSFLVRITHTVIMKWKV